NSAEIQARVNRPAHEEFVQAPGRFRRAAGGRSKITGALFPGPVPRSATTEMDSATMTGPTVLSFFDNATKSYSYVVADESKGVCAVVDSVLDFDIKSGRTSTKGADALIAAVQQRNWRTDWVLETHAHADHLTAAPYVKAKLGGQIAIGAKIPVV